MNVRVTVKHKEAHYSNISVHIKAEGYEIDFTNTALFFINESFLQITGAFIYHAS